MKSSTIPPSVLLLLLPAVGVLTFNLEPKLPVIKRGELSSFFGYSVAEHLTLNNESWILVGAPLGQNLQPGTNRSGALFKCPPLSGMETDCVQIVTDGKRVIDRDELSPPDVSELKDGQWLGVNVRSQGPGGKVMVCAHRYVHQGREFRWGVGLCHFLTESLNFDQTLFPCYQQQQHGLEDYGYCQAGTSAFLMKDDMALLGAPGAFTARGSIYGISVSDDYLNKDRTQYHSPALQNNPVDKYSYLGWSVTGAKFFGDQWSYATGAPRAANGSGQVVFFSKEQDEDLRQVAILTGEGFAFSFGYDLAALDLNGDGKPDLVVGAPFYVDAKGGGGAAYVYMNDGKPGHSGFQPNTTYVRLTGPSESRFGFAITTLGDLNKDGYEDLAVGAPYAESGTGIVYIYLGSKNGIIEDPSQVIRASEYFHGLKTFGYSLSGGLDMDRNTYPDLLVGAYDSDMVIFLRARPIIDIVTEVIGNLTGIDPAGRGCPEDPNSTLKCFSFKACFEIREVSIVRTFFVGVKYHLEAETFAEGRKFSRVTLRNGTRDKPQVRQGEINVKRGDVGQQCVEELVYLNEGTKDIQSPISFKLSYTLNQRVPVYFPNTSISTIDNYPILNQQEATRIFQVQFEKDCGQNDLCESDLYITAKTDLYQDEQGYYQLMLGKDKELVLHITIQNFGEPAYGAMMYLSHPKSMHFKGRAQEGADFGCTPFNTTLISCPLGNPYKNKSRESHSLRLDATDLKDIETRLDFFLWANSTSIETDETNDHVVVTAIVIKKAEISISARSEPSDVLYTGVVKGESAMKNLSDIGPRVNHTYEIFNHGPWKASHFNVVIYWPHQVGNNNTWKEGKWLLYPEKMPKVEGDGECYLPTGVIDVLELGEKQILQKRTKRSLRTKRESETVVSSEIEEDSLGTKRKIVKMDCVRRSALCFRFECIIRNLLPQESAVIKIHSRLWEGTLVEDYPSVDQVRISSRAELKMSEDNRQDPGNDADMATTNAIPDLKLKVEYGVAWWIYALSILAGILVLAFIVYCLHKSGFFKRRRPQPTHTASVVKS